MFLNDPLLNIATEEQKYTNRLINETSPYLLLHAHNPVDWFPWGAEAFAKAKRKTNWCFFPLATVPATGVMSWNGKSLPIQRLHQL